MYPLQLTNTSCSSHRARRALNAMEKKLDRLEDSPTLPHFVDVHRRGGRQPRANR